MTDQNEEKSESWFERGDNVSQVYRGLWVVCIALAAVDLFYHKHVVFEVEHFPGIYGIYAFIVCIGLVLGARVLRKILKRDEDYYDR